MKKKEVVELKKPVAMIHISGDLTLVERKLANVLLLNAYKDLTTQEEHTVSVPALYEFMGWDKESNNVDHLRKALNRLQTTLIKFDRLTKRGKTAWEDVQLVGRGKIENGVCIYSYDKKLAERMANPETAFGMIDIDIQNRFASGFALALYENCVRFKQIGTTGFHDIKLWRELIGADSSLYDDFKHFNSKVLSPSMKQINQNTDIEITPEFQREKRRVTTMRYSVKNKAQKALPLEGIGLEEARKTDLFKRLVDYGVDERLALEWIMNRPERTLAAVEQMDMQVKVADIQNTAGYIRKIVESNGAIGPSRRKADQKGAVAVESDKNERLKALIRDMPDKERRAYAAEYIAGPGVAHATSYNPATGKFRSALERIPFETWLRGKLGSV